MRRCIDACRAALLSVVAAQAGCGGDCVPTLYTGGPVACGPDLSMYLQATFAEPQPGSRDTSPSGSSACEAPGLMWFEFPPEANAGRLARSYWLTGAEDVSFKVRLAVTSPASDNGLDHWRGLVLVDGRQVMVSADDGPAGPDFKLPEGAGAKAGAQLRLDHRSIDTGAHTVVVMLTFQHVRAGRAIAGNFAPTSWPNYARTFTVLKQGTQFRHRPTSTGVQLLPAVPTRAGSLLMLPRSFSCPECRPASDGTLTVTFAIKPVCPACEDESYGWSLVALLDGAEFPFGDAGFAPRFDVGATEQALFDVVFKNLPVADGKPHSLFVYQVNDGRYTEAPPGRRSPWSLETALFPLLEVLWPGEPTALPTANAASIQASTPAELCGVAWMR
jgi:hypothetical protein